jgi:hypothetical protein
MLDAYLAAYDPAIWGRVVVHVSITAALQSFKSLTVDDPRSTR